eukprot:1411077-Rhodomonas_salina.2
MSPSAPPYAYVSTEQPTTMRVWQYQNTHRSAPPCARQYWEALRSTIKSVLRSVAWYNSMIAQHTGKTWYAEQRGGGCYPASGSDIADLTQYRTSHTMA